MFPELGQAVVSSVLLRKKTLCFYKLNICKYYTKTVLGKPNSTFSSAGANFSSLRPEIAYDGGGLWYLYEYVKHP